MQLTFHGCEKEKLFQHPAKVCQVRPVTFDSGGPPSDDSTIQVETGKKAPGPNTLLGPASSRRGQVVSPPCEMTDPRLRLRGPCLGTKSLLERNQGSKQLLN